ncbi:MAG: restriction endonuclease [Ignavibacteriales bacterium]|nr:restriction endonuclease [Ignavibacteriales bacterium]
MIPDFQTIMLPLIEILSDKKTHRGAELKMLITDRFGLTDEERQALLPGGTQTKIDNRVHWALFYLKKANLVKSASRGIYEITATGLEIHSNAPQKINVKFLKSIPTFKQWQDNYQANKASNTHPIDTNEDESESTPEEQLEYSHQKLEAALSTDLIDKIKASSPRFFEILVVDLLIKMGYGGSRVEAGKILGKSHDGGIDGLIKEDKLGLDTIYIQAKKWDNSVPITQIRDFAGSLLAKKAKKGIFITTSSFPKTAYEFVASIEPKIVLIDGAELAELMIENNVGVAIKKTYEVKRIDIDYFEEN